MDLFLSVSEALGFDRDRDIAGLAGVIGDNVDNWRSGAVQEFKRQTLNHAKASLTAYIARLRQRALLARQAPGEGLHPLTIEEGSGPDALLRQFRDRIGFDYLGHRFLYYEPQGALAWMRIIQEGYEQDAWMRGIRQAAGQWLGSGKDPQGRPKSPLADALGVGTKYPRGIDVIGLGCGDGSKEVAVLDSLLSLISDHHPPEWLSFVPVDVSIPLLLRAASAGRDALAKHVASDEDDARDRFLRYSVQPLCADFEEGSLRFEQHLDSTVRGGDISTRLILLLGNTFGNLRDEERFVRHKLWRLARRGDFVWLEVAIRMEPITSDPLYGATQSEHTETAAEASRRQLLEGPFRRWEAALGRAPERLKTRIWLRHDDASARIQGSYNFCHDLVLEAQGRVCTMLYSRRYQLDDLITWLGRHEFDVVRNMTIRDSKKRPRVAHLLLRRR
ncbi:MAG: putative SAM-dependent methyltransferase [Myxococcota bacterium]|jgi:uncharacterized SAM-dependent methyltransferase